MNGERKNFPIKTIEEVFEEQGRACGKCGKSLFFGYAVHHKDGDSSNDARENCQLLCGNCHDSEQWKTIEQQKKESIGQLDSLIDKAVKGEIAGALLDKALDAIKLKLSLQGQTNNIGLLEAPSDVKLESYVVVMEAKQRAYLEGFIKGLETIHVDNDVKLDKVKKNVRRE